MSLFQMTPQSSGTGTPTHHGESVDSKPMSFHSSSQRAAIRMPRVAALLLVLGGLFAMHGLADHGTEHATDSMPAHHTMSAGAPADATAMDLVVVQASAPLEDHAGHAMTDLCLAFLTAGLLALVLLRGSSRVPFGLRGTRSPGDGRFRPMARDPDPPTPLRLSIQRC